jgi:hypothetical protein
VTTAEASTTESIARRVPNCSVKKRAIEVIEPLSSISLPNKGAVAPFPGIMRLL